jgi:opacity protein-like surface antigen
MKRLALSLLVLSSGLGICATTLASPSGAYILIGGGGVYLPNSKLSYTTVTSTPTGTFDFNGAISQTQEAATDYTGRGALGYYFYRDPSKSYSFGLEAGYNYFGPVTSKASNALTVPDTSFSFPVTTNEKTTAWSSDLEFVFTQDMVIPKTSLIFKLGAGYESLTNQITNIISVPALPASQKITTQGVGAAGGIGLQYNFTPHFALRTELDGLKGGKNIGYAQGLAGLVFSF